MMYSKTVMDHFRNPRNVGIIENANGVGEVGNPLCGDMMTIYLDVQDDIICRLGLHGRRRRRARCPVPRAQSGSSRSRGGSFL